MGLDILSIIMIIWGLAILVGIGLRLNFYWNSRRVRHSRETFGESRARTLYLIVGVLMVILGIWVIVT